MSCSASDFTSRVAPEVIGADQIVIENAVQDAIIEFCSESWVIQKGMQFSVASDDIDSDTNNTVDLDVSGKITDIRPTDLMALNIDGTDYSVIYRDDLDDLTYIDKYHGDEEVFFNIPDNSTITLYPVAEACTVYLRAVCVPTRSATTYPDFLLEDWLEGIAYGAKARLMAMQRKKWTNGTGALVNEKRFRQQIGKARQKWQKNYSNASTSVNPRSFGEHL